MQLEHILFYNFSFFLNFYSVCNVPVCPLTWKIPIYLSRGNSHQIAISDRDHVLTHVTIGMLSVIARMNGFYRDPCFFILFFLNTINILYWSIAGNNAVVVSGEQQRDSTRHIHVSILLQTTLPFSL